MLNEQPQIIAPFQIGDRVRIMSSQNIHFVRDVFMRDGEWLCKLDQKPWSMTMYAQCLQLVDVKIERFTVTNTGRVLDVIQGGRS